MERRTFLTNSILGASGLAGVANAGLDRDEATAVGDGKTVPIAGSNDTVGRPVRITSISFANGLPLEEIVGYVDRAGAAHVDVIALPETCRGQKENTQEALDGPTLNAMSALAKKHNTYILCPIDRHSGTSRLNTAVLLDRNGKVACLYNKVFPYWAEFDLHPPVDVGEEAPVYTADFGKAGTGNLLRRQLPRSMEAVSRPGRGTRAVAQRLLCGHVVTGACHQSPLLHRFNHSHSRLPGV